MVSVGERSSGRLWICCEAQNRTSEMFDQVHVSVATHWVPECEIGYISDEGGA